MFETLQALLDAIAALSVDLSPEARAAQITELTDPAHVDPAQLSVWLGEAAEAAQAILAEPLTDESLATLDVLRQATEAIAAGQAALAAHDADVAAQAAEMAEAIRTAAGAQASDTPPEGEPAPGEGETPPAEGTPGEGTPAETEGAPAEGTPPAEGAPEGEGAPAEAAAPTPEMVAASAAEARQRAIRANARRPGAVRLPAARESVQAGAGALPEDIEEWGLVASANAGRLTAGTQIRTRADLSEAVLAAVSASRDFFGPSVNVPLFTIGGQGSRDELRALGYSEDRILDRDYIANQDRIWQAASDMAIMARGGFGGIQASLGICAPQQVNYDQPTLGDDARPVRDQALVRFGAERGGVRLFPPVILEDVEDAVGIWTNETDTDPQGATKPCLSLTCPEDEEALVAAITRCLEIGNFRSRFFGEQVEAWLRQTGVWHARVAERRLLAQMSATSTHVSSGQILGTVPDTIADLELATAGIRSNRRLVADMPLRWVIPAWFLDQMAADQARSMPAGTADERFALSDADITRWLAARRITPVFAMDGPAQDVDDPSAGVRAGQEFSRQGDGPLNPWPSTAVTWLYPDGAHLFLDGGQLDFGITRDSTLNSTNDFQMFAETFEGHAFQGDVAYELTLDTCPSGQRAELADSSGVCTTGS